MEGTTVFVLGNGPVLAGHDLGVLDGLMTVGVNRILKIYDPVVHFWYSPKFTNETAAPTFEKSKALKVVMKESLPDIPGFHTVNRYNQCVPDWSNLIKNRRWLPVEWDGDFDIYETTGKASGRCATGSSAVCWALSLPNCKQVVTLGMEGYICGGLTNFYGNNPHHIDRTYEWYGSGLDAMRDACEYRGIDLIEGPDQETLEEICSSLKKHSREEYEDLIWASALDHLYTLKRADA